MITRLAHIVAGIALGFSALGFLVFAIEETHWALTTIVPSRLCGDGKSGSCVTRTAALVVAKEGSHFSVSYDNAKQVQDLTAVGRPAPAVGSHVVLEEWKDRVVSVLGPGQTRRHASEWPNVRHDLGEGLIGIVGLVLCGGALAWLIVRLGQDNGVDSSSSSTETALPAVSAEHARTS